MSTADKLTCAALAAFILAGLALLGYLARLFWLYFGWAFA